MQFVHTHVPEDPSPHLVTKRTGGTFSYLFQIANLLVCRLPAHHCTVALSEMCPIEPTLIPLPVALPHDSRQRVAAARRLLSLTSSTQLGSHCSG